MKVVGGEHIKKIRDTLLEILLPNETTVSDGGPELRQAHELSSSKIAELK